MPSPRPIKRQWDRSFAVPRNKRGYHASGASMMRPSASSIFSVSLVTETLSAVTSRNSLVKVFIPTLQQLSLVLLGQLLQPCQFMTAKASTLREANWIEPEFGFVFLSLDVAITSVK